MQLRRLFFILFFGLISTFSNAQNGDILSKKVTLTASNQSLVFVFQQIQKQTGAVFSYNSDLIDDQRKISFSYVDKSLEMVLKDLKQKLNFNYKVKKNYILLSAISEVKPKEIPVSQSIVIKGYIYNSKDSSVIENTSIYIVDGRNATLSNENGFFEIKSTKQKNSIFLKIAKENFQDTTITISGFDKQNVQIFLSANPPLIANSIVDTVASLDLVKNIDTLQSASETEITDSQTEFVSKYMKYFGKLKNIKQNLLNIKDTLFTKYSFSLLPLVSTNKLLSVNTINNVSLNLLVGFSKGTQKAEFGGIANINTGNVQFIQAAGITNIVKGNVKGVQISGIANITKGELKGAQLAGTFNILGQNGQGVQIAGTFNHTNHNFKGIQLAGVFNNSKSASQLSRNINKRRKSYFQGVQIAGTFNTADTIEGAQISGVFNESFYLKGVQIGGVFNKSKISNGLQLGTCFNVADTLNGNQIAIFFNSARKFHGKQIALLNISDSCTGLPIGLISYVRKGYNRLELSGNEIFNFNLNLKTGVSKFYNIFQAGLNFNKNLYLANLGYGLGNRHQLSAKWYYKTEIIANKTFSYSGSSKLNFYLLNLKTQIELQIYKKISIAIGPSINWAMGINNPTALNQIAPNSSTAKQKMWFGLVGGVSF